MVFGWIVKLVIFLGIAGRLFRHIKNTISAQTIMYVIELGIKGKKQRNADSKRNSKRDSPRSNTVSKGGVDADRRDRNDKHTR